MQDVLKFFAPKLLLVEGRDEERFFPAFLHHLGIENVQVVSYGGKPQFGSNLKVFVVTGGFEQVSSLGIIRDADASATSALQSVQDNLRNVGLTAPSDFLLPSDSIPRVSVFVMPNNSDEGELEHLCLEALQDDLAMPCTEDFVECFTEALDELPENLAKAKMHAFLSSREKSYLHIGEAADAGYFPWRHSAFAALAEFLSNL